MDDTEDAARLLGDVLSQKGYHTRVALDAPAALEAAMEIRPDVAILDIGLPVMDGTIWRARCDGSPAWPACS